jgi:hypothetical protein
LHRLGTSLLPEALASSPEDSGHRYLQTAQLAHWVEPDGAPLPEMT